MGLGIEDFQQEIAAAVKSYDKFVVCVEKTPDEFLKSLQSLMGKAIMRSRIARRACVTALRWTVM